MSGTTANKGYVYPTSTDSPLQFPTQFAQFAGQVDTNAASYDADAARLQSNNFVKISANNYPANSTVAYDTVEVNRGTPTDLTQFNGIMLGPGLWLVGGSYTFQGSGTSGLSGAIFGMYIAQNPPFVYITGRFTRDAGTALATSTTGGLLGWPNQTMSLAAPYYVASGTSKITMSLGSTGEVTPYADLWAWQIGDL